MAENSHLFWRPGAARPAAAASSLVDRDRADESSSVVFNPNERLTLSQQRLRLPIFANRRQLLYMVERYRTTVVVGHTGCGKTTQIPQYLHEAGWTAGGRVVCCTQPRRVAAISVAQRVADEMGESLGGTVGYAVRFDDCSSREATRLKFVTDGTLLSEMMQDPLLSRYSVVMVDEAHERSVQVGHAFYRGVSYHTHSPMQHDTICGVFFVEGSGRRTRRFPYSRVPVACLGLCIPGERYHSPISLHPYPSIYLYICIHVYLH